ncbi:MAG: Crp/Fnr family transcriptional regulator [Thermoanaerobacterales bacterium]|nr:Crp/Fnr family transcriptional regulator [Bacillota bacterium]MDI6906364.1 Crp/Fnr family transcriptional regulator [Thermoanaerobacterales bacterium]
MSGDVLSHEEDALVVNEREHEMLCKTGIKVHYPKGQIIFSADEYADRVYLVEEGYVKIYRLNPDGREVTVGSIRNPGEMMGLAETLYHGTRTCFAGAITDVTLVILTKAQFLDVLTTEHRLALKVASLLGARMRAAEAMVYDLMCWQAPGRLALMLLKIGERCGVKTNEGIRIKLKLTHNEIASMIGSTRQTVTSLMNTFRDENCIAVDGREIVIKDSKKLAEWVV